MIYRTQPNAMGAQGGSDAILIRSQRPYQFCFLEGKGTPRSPREASEQFNSVLGTILKRIKITSDYRSNENADRFTDPNMREIIAREAKLDVCRYVLALPSEMEKRLEINLDPELARMLHLDAFLVHGDGSVRKFLFSNE